MKNTIRINKVFSKMFLHKEGFLRHFFTTKENDEGTGMVLSVVYVIIKSQEGHIQIYSEIKKR